MTIYFDCLDPILFIHRMQPPDIRTVQIVRVPLHPHQHPRPRRWAQNALPVDVPIENIRVR